MTVAGEVRDLDAVRAGLQRWFDARRAGGDRVRVGPMAKPTMGYSSETLLFDVARTTGGEEVDEGYVARLPPAGGGIFPDYDLRRQADVQRALLECGIPAAAPVAVELDEDWVGAPFFLMERIPGTTIPDGYVRSGPLHDAAPDVQRRVQAEYVDRLADVHTLDWEAAGLGFLTPAHARGLVHDLARLDEYLGWATDGDVPPVLGDGLDWLRAHRPDPEPPWSLCWGDPRLGNVLYGPDWGQRALLDWEMASIGPAEMDVAWFLALHDTAAAGADLPGFATSAEMRDRWSARVGREVQAYGWFEVFSLLRAEAIYQRIRTMLLASGLDEPWLRATTPGELRIASLVG